MQTSDSMQYDPILHKHIFTQSNGLLAWAFIMVCFAEISLILTFLPKRGLHIGVYPAILVQLGFLMPAITALILLHRIRKKVKEGVASPSFAAWVSEQIATLLMIVYMAFLTFVSFYSPSLT
jgi:hypothetical protein